MRGLSGKEWVILEDNLRPPTYLVNRFGPFIAQILVNRGADERALEKSLKEIPHYKEIPNIEESLQVIYDAIKSRKPILIFGDYDTDGITGTALLYHFLKKNLKANVFPYLPKRHMGYGLNMDLIKKFERFADLIITVDNGTTATNEINACKKPIIVIDHHNPSEEVPKALILNPKLNPNAPKDLKEVSSVALVFYLVYLLSKEFPLDFDVREYLHLVAIGTIGDVMPLNHLNRVLVSKGMDVLNYIRKRKTNFVGMKMLLNSIKGDNGDITSKDIAFSIVPRLNAPGRLDDPRVSLELLIASNERKALALLEKIEKLNRIRKKLVNEEYEKLLKSVENQKEKSLISVVVDDVSKAGILGILAGRLANTFGKPAIVLNVGGDVAVGSARSVEGVDIYSLLKNFSHMFLKWGGHTYAAGLTIPKNQLKEFQQKLQEVFSQASHREVKLYIDMRMETFKLKDEVINQIRRLEPFGEGFPEPIFLSENLRLKKEEGSTLTRTVFKSENGFTFVSWDISLNRKLLEVSHYEGRVVYSVDLSDKNLLTLVDLQEWR